MNKDINARTKRSLLMVAMVMIVFALLKPAFGAEPEVDRRAGFLSSHLKPINLKGFRLDVGLVGERTTNIHKPVEVKFGNVLGTLSVQLSPVTSSTKTDTLVCRVLTVEPAEVDAVVYELGTMAVNIDSSAVYEIENVTDLGSYVF